MTLEEIIAACQASLQQHGYIVFSDEVYAALNEDIINALRERFGVHELWRLPQQEIDFFEWLKVNDVEVWNDLWADNHTAPYLVSLAYLGATFHICDLQTQDNYYFAPLMFHDKASADFLSAIRGRFDQRQSLSASQALALEASLGPVDIWHFAYRRGLDINVAKKAVATLVDDGILVHVTKAEHLTEYFDVH
jgi:hypothetical protein